MDPHGHLSGDLEGYLRRLGLAAAPPSVDALFALHRAQVERITYECLDFHLDRPVPLDVTDSVARVVRGRGGYCFQLNGALAALLEALGYDVTRHRAGVQNTPAEPAGASGNHVALTVRLGGERWLVDAGLGDGIHEPLPLRAGTYTQGPFGYGLQPSTAEPGGWRFTHDPRGSFHAMDFSPAAVRLGDFAAEHRRLSTSPESGFVRVVTAQRRDAGGVDVLRGCVLRRIGEGGEQQWEIGDRDAWFDVLTGTFGLDLGDVDATDRDRLWSRIRKAHEAWQAAAAG